MSTVKMELATNLQGIVIIVNLAFMVQNVQHVAMATVNRVRAEEAMVTVHILAPSDIMDQPARLYVVFTVAMAVTDRQACVMRALVDDMEISATKPATIRARPARVINKTANASDSVFKDTMGISARWFAAPPVLEVAIKQLHIVSETAK